MEAPEFERRIAGVAALDQPLRRNLYRLLSTAGGWTTRDEAAEALGLPRSVAAFHLDKLVEAGVVEVRFERTSGRTGPGAGRPSKLYRPRGEEVSASVPDRRYDLAGSLLAAAVAEATRTGRPVGHCVSDVARAAGRRLGEEAAAAAGPFRRAEDRRQAVVDVLAGQGYEPVVVKRKEVVLANCPFHRLAEEHRDLVCGMNLDFLGGLLEGMGPACPL
ncbi:MAG TPA: helix-turn-helix domain-containing protein, partial [Acidimicrobiales bacterium]|nr:helix-turn-helix domain-containing protein [Acidimicrobiales bacterium]